MTPIFTDLTAASRASALGDLEHRKMLIQAGEELKRSPAIQYYLQYQYYKQANDLLSLRVSQSDGDNQFSFMLAHNNVQTRLDTLKSLWLLGEKLDDLVAEYQEVANHQQTDQE